MGRGQSPPSPLNFGLWENVILVGKSASKNATFGVKKPFGGKFRDNI